MVYECDDCSAALPPGVLACPRCGEQFEEPVPADAVLPKRGFSAVGPPPAPLVHVHRLPGRQHLQESQILLQRLRLASHEREGTMMPKAPRRAALTPVSVPAISGGSPSLRMAGRILMLGGLAVAGYYWLSSEPSAAVSRNGILIGLGDLLLGTLMLLTGRKIGLQYLRQKLWKKKRRRTNSSSPRPGG